MTRPTTIVLVGIGGYGNTYLSELLDSPNQHPFSIIGAVDPDPISCRRLDELKARNIPIVSSLDSFYESRAADLAIISSPSRFHASQTDLALSHASHVLCEKPLCPTPHDSNRMLASQIRWKKHVSIGYQWSFSRAIQHLKADILSGALGKPIRLRTLVLWPRDEAYYHRNNWAGALKASDGTWLLDSPVNNAGAHFFHNMLYLLGDRVDQSIVPTTVTAELYRAYPIQNYDTAAVRCKTGTGAELLFFTSHAVSHRRGPEFIFEFEKATVHFVDSPHATIVADFKDRSTKNYGCPNDERMKKLSSTIDAIAKGEDSICGISAAAAHTHCCWAIQQSSPSITTFGKHLIHTEDIAGQRQLVVDGLAEDLIGCYTQGRLPSEVGFVWANRATPITIQREPAGIYTFRNES